MSKQSIKLFSQRCLAFALVMILTAIVSLSLLSLLSPHVFAQIDLQRTFTFIIDSEVENALIHLFDDTDDHPYAFPLTTQSIQNGISTLSVLEGASYRYQVSALGYIPAEGSITVGADSTYTQTVDLEVAPPTITEQPKSQILTSEELHAVLSVTAHGLGALSYQWYHQEIPIAGATSPTLELQDLSDLIIQQQPMAYTCVVSSDLTDQTVTSDLATLTIEQPPACSDDNVVHTSMPPVLPWMLWDSSLTPSTLAFEQPVPVASIQQNTAQKALPDRHRPEKPKPGTAFDATGHYTISNADGTQISDPQTHGWYIGNDFVISPKEGFLISASPDGKWTHSLTHHEDTAKGSLTFYLKCVGSNEDDIPIEQISKAQTEKFKIDKTPPKNVTLHPKSPKQNLTRSSDSLTFFHDQASLTLSASDETSRIHQVEWQIIGQKGMYDTTPVERQHTQEVDGEKSGTWQIDLPEQFYGKVIATVHDCAGNKTVVETEQTLVVDQVAPTINVQYDPVQMLRQDDLTPITDGEIIPGNTTLYHHQAAQISVEIDEANFFEQDVLVSIDRIQSDGTLSPVVTDSSQLIQNWVQTPETSLFTGSLTLQEEGDYIITIKYTDKSNNQMKTHCSERLTIDTTAPLISVSYDNNNNVKNDTFDAPRTATITITEENFSVQNATDGIVITNQNGDAPTLSSWKRLDSSDSENPQPTSYQATVYFSEDGTYTLDIHYADNATNPNAPVDYQDSVHPNKFVIAKQRTVPHISVVYDNTNAQNGNYYQTSRTATITVKYADFDSSQFVVHGTATDGSQTVSFPNISDWKSDGDTHTATLHFSEDATYRLAVSYTDEAGNTIAQYPQDVFTIDQTAPALTLTGIEDNMSYDGTVLASIDYHDRNFDANYVSISLMGSNRGSVTPIFSYEDHDDGQTVLLKNFEQSEPMDDIYTLTTSVTDLAGNSSTQTIVFSVNRFGSVYTFDRNLQEISGKYVYEEVDVVVIETNVDHLKRESINLKMTLNGIPTDLTPDTDYVVEKTGGGAWNPTKQWSQYKYTINKQLFSSEGQYTVALYSEDEAGNINENIHETKQAEIAFGIDKTPPAVVAVDIENKKVYDTNGRDATFSIKDNLVLENVIIQLNGETVQPEVNEENYTIHIPSSSETQTVKVYAADAAGNNFILDLDDIVVRRNLFPAFTETTPSVWLLWGVGSLVVAGALITSLWIYKSGKLFKK